MSQFEVSTNDFDCGIVDFLAEKTQVFASKGEARRMLKSNAVSINKEKVNEDKQINSTDLISDK